MSLRKNYFTVQQKEAFNGRIKKVFLDAGFPQVFANLAVAQANFESGNYSNNAFIDHNNAFGYKYYKDSKWQSGTGNTSSEKDSYASYKSLEDSANEIASWWKRRFATCSNNNPPVMSQIDNPEKYVRGLVACNPFYFFTNGKNPKLPPTETEINNYIYGMSSISQKLKFFYSQNKPLVVGVGAVTITVGVSLFFYIKYIVKNKKVKF